MTTTAMTVHVLCSFRQLRRHDVVLAPAGVDSAGTRPVSRLAISRRHVGPARPAARAAAAGVLPSPGRGEAHSHSPALGPPADGTI